MNYFKDCITQEDVKRLYREWAKKLHPDHGGKAEDMVELQKQYENWVKPNPFRQQYQMNEEEFLKGQQAYQKYYGGFGGYRYSNQSTMWNEYKKQESDPRLAYYERMKSENISLNNENYHLKCRLSDYKIENESLKKNLESMKRKLEKLKNPSKAKKVGKSSPSICL